MAPPDLQTDSPRTRGRHRRRSHAPTENRGAALLSLVDAGIAGSLLVVPFVMGGRTPIGQLAFSAVSFWSAIWWTIHQAVDGDRRWQGTSAFLPMFGAVGLVFLQIVPLPVELLGQISPRIHELLPLWSSATADTPGLGPWETVSLTPEVTRQSLILLLSGVLLFTVTVQRVREIRDIERVVRWLAISVSLMAVFGIAQFLTSNDKFFWLYEHPYSETGDCVKGAFTNRNHFAHFMALGIGALVWWLVFGDGHRTKRAAESASFGRASRRFRVETAFKAMLLPLCVLATFITFSRGGVVVLLASGATILLLLWRAKKLSGKILIGAFLCSGIFVCVGLSIHGYDTLARRFEGSISAAALENRARLWSAAVSAFREFPIAGTGLSSHSSVCPIYLEPVFGDDSIDYTHAENGYVQIAMETGTPGLVFALAALGFWCYWCVSASRKPHPRVSGCLVAIAPALIASVVHSALDFVWYVPGCMAVVAVLAACAFRLQDLGRSERSTGKLPRLVWIGGGVLLIAVATGTMSSQLQAVRAERPWNRYLYLKHSLRQLKGEAEGEDVYAQTEDRKRLLAAMTQELDSVLESRPGWALAQACMAETHRDLFHEYQLTADNPFDLRMLRESIFSNFDSVEAAREWLPRGVGAHYVHLDAALKHAHRAAELEPLRAEAYLILAQLSFLEGPAAPSKSAYVQQAYRTRPNHGTVLFEIGQEASLAGRYELTLAYWKRSFQRGEEHQQRLVELLAGRMPARTFLQAFRPDADAMAVVARQYERVGRPEEMNVVWAAHASACETKARTLSAEEAAAYWCSASNNYRKLGDLHRQRICLERALAGDSVNFGIRMALGRCHLSLKEFRAAEEQFRWCYRRKPENPQVQRLLEQAVRNRIATADTSTRSRSAALPRSSHPPR